MCESCFAVELVANSPLVRVSRPLHVVGEEPGLGEALLVLERLEVESTLDVLVASAQKHLASVLQFAAHALPSLLFNALKLKDEAPCHRLLTHSHSQSIVGQSAP